MNKSFYQQVMMNYFDYTDVRSRQNSTSLENQLLNMAAVELESLNLRSFRESAQTLETVPTNIDNGGIYFGAQLPQSLLPQNTPPTFSSVVGFNGSSMTTLVPYDDTLPIPAYIDLDSTRSVPLSNPILFTLTGIGDTQALVWAVQYAYPSGIVTPFPVPNVLSVWVDQLTIYQSNVVLTIVGEIHPQPAWVAERKTTTEVITISGEGFAQTHNRWSNIHQVAVRGLPQGARIRGYCMPFNLPAVPDLARPFTTPQDRLLTFNRYWEIDNSDGLLKEVYDYSGFAGMLTYQSYLLNDTLIDVAVEPNTNGIFAVSGTKLYYADRREVMPSLLGTGLMAEPFYGLSVTYDDTKTGLTRYVVLAATAYATASSLFQYRYTVNGANSVLPNGALGPMNQGWRIGTPIAVSVPMLQSGNYTFRLEQQDASGNTVVDVVPWHNPEFTPLASLDITDLTDTVASIAFDDYGTLWFWNGTFITPVVIHYNAYVFDQASQMIFATDSFDALEVTL